MNEFSIGKKYIYTKINFITSRSLEGTFYKYIRMCVWERIYAVLKRLGTGDVKSGVRGNRVLRDNVDGKWNSWT